MITHFSFLPLFSKAIVQIQRASSHIGHKVTGLSTR
uniref:Uncharacterized protein n=1 Tax=Rhizophora mucronata TaxID=61149 RepID=A0A2P2IPT0_RHIMU